MGQRVALVGAVALPIWEILQDRRNRVLFGIVRQPDACRQRRAVFQRYQGVLDNMHRSWKGRDNHRALQPDTITIPATSRLTSWRKGKNRQPLLSVNDGSHNHGTVQRNPTQTRQIDIPVMPPDSKP